MGPASATERMKEETMPYLDLSDLDQFIQLQQLFLAAHPDDQAMNQVLRDHTELSGEYFLSADTMRRMARWAQERHLITRKTAAHLIEMALLA